MIVYMFYIQYKCRTRVVFLQQLTSLARKKSLGRVGLISLSECIASAASVFGLGNNSEGECFDGSSLSAQGDLIDYSLGCKMELLDDLRFVVENSKQHFNPSYRIQGLWLFHMVKLSFMFFLNG